MKKAFTLIELLIVVSIIGILAVVLVPNISDAPSRARDAGRISEVNDLISAVESFYIDNSRYPAGFMCIGPIDLSIPTSWTEDAPDVSGGDSADEALFISDYLGGEAPSSPSVLPETTYCDDGTDSYYIYFSSGGNSYFVGVILENEGQAIESLPLDTEGEEAYFYRVDR